MSESNIHYPPLPYITTDSIRCSRCKLRKLVPSDWKYTECERCHVRTGSRNDKRRQKAKKSIIQQLGNFDEAYEGHKKLAKKLGTKPMSKKGFFDKWLVSQKAKEQRITETLRHFSSQSAPILSFVCLRFRERARPAKRLRQPVRQAQIEPKKAKEELGPFYTNSGTRQRAR